MPSFPRRLALAAGLALCAGAAQAQLIVTSISANAAAPVDGDMVVFTVAVTAPGSCFTDPTQTMQGDIEGSDVPLVLPPCDDTGLPNDTDFTFQAQVGQFWLGTYTVQVFRNADFPGGAPVGSLTLVVGAGSINNGNGNGNGLCGHDPCFKAAVNACNPVFPPGPCNLILDITNAINGAPTTSTWTYYLDSAMGRWKYNTKMVVGSENEPVMAAAIALWVSPSGTHPSVIDTSTTPPQAFNAYQWWSTFLNCQNGGSYCPNTASNTTQQYFNGAEVLSTTYGGYVTLSVASVALWAQKHPTLDTLGVGAAAGHFLQKTMGLWALGAGATWANTLTYVHAPNTAPMTSTCEGGGSNFPFLALAGARSVITDFCHDDRGPIFASAIGYAIGACQEPTWNNRLREAIQCAWTLDAYGDNVYGVSATNGQHLQGFIGVPAYQSIISEGDYNTAATIVNVLKGSRFIHEYHFLSWQGERGSVLYANPNTNTVATYAVSYKTSTQAAIGLWPWVTPRTNSTVGYGELLGSPYAPTGAQASNCYPNGLSCGPANPAQTQSLTFPGSGYYYQIILTPTADAIFK